MLRRWKASPRPTQWLAGGIVAVVVTLAVVWVLFVPAADWLAHHDVGPVTGSLHEIAVDNARGRLLTLGAGLFAAGALVFTARNFTVSRRTFELTEQGQVTDRYTKAIEQLGSDKLDVRIGGIYALERVARDSAKDHPTVMEVLTAFIREHSREQWPTPDSDGQERPRAIRPDVQAAITVVARRNAHSDIQVIDITGAILSGAKLLRANLAGANLTDVKLVGADLEDADFTGAQITRADFTLAILEGADLSEAILLGSDFTRADLQNANLTNAILGGYLTAAELADLNDLDLGRVNLLDANLEGAMWPRGEPVPEGWKLNPDTGRLERTDTDSG